jgi:enoyl-CoA hydratase
MSTTDEGSALRFETRGRVGLATIERQERRNALNGDICAALTQSLADHPDLLAVVITGAGSAFCAGADLVTRFGSGEGGAHGGDTFRPNFEVLLDAITDYPSPVIAAVNGPAIGAGMQLAVACDIRITGTTARFSIPGGRLGILLSPKNIWRLGHLVGHGLARDFLLTGRTVDADEALRIGLVQRADADPLGAALTLADELARLAPLTVRGHKRALNLVCESVALSDSAVAEIQALEAAAFASDDLSEGMAAFADKRDPVFEGR